ncbi:helix-turn-helix domain-containing protein [Enterococcus sp. LJL98]
MEYILSSLIENRNQILLSVLEVIAKEQRWYSITEISEELGVVERSVQRYVNILDDFFEEYEMTCGPRFTLLSKRTKGVYLIIDDNTNFNQLKKFIYQNDECIKIYNEIIFGHFESKSKYAQENFLSISYVSASIKKIEEVLSEFYIRLSPSGFQLEGEEAQIRLILYTSAWSLYGGSELPAVFQPFDIEKLNEKIDHLIDSLGLSVTKIQKREMTLMLLITILRYRQNKIIQMDDAWANYFSNDLNNPLVILIKEIFESYYIFSQPEVVFFAVSLMTRPYLYQQDTYRKRLIARHQAKQTDVYTATVLFMSEFSKELMPIPDKDYDEIFLAVFRNHLYCKTYKNAPFDYNAHDYFNFIEENYPRLFEKLSEFVDNLYEKSQNVIFLKRVFLIQHYLLIFSHLKPISYFEKSMTIQIETDLPDLAVRRIEDYLTSYFKYRYNLKFLKGVSLQQADLVLSSIPFFEEDEINHLFIDYPLNQRNLLDIEKHVASHVTSRRDNFFL